MMRFESYSSQVTDTISILQQQLDDISSKQKELYNQINSTRDRSLTEEEFADVKALMDRTSVYRSKLLSIRTMMVNMSIKSKQLLKRSDKLKATKVDYLSKIEGIRRLEQERDQSIAAKLKQNDQTTISRSTSSDSLRQASTPTSSASSPSSPSRTESTTVTNIHIPTSVATIVTVEKEEMNTSTLSDDLPTVRRNLSTSTSTSFTSATATASVTISPSESSSVIATAIRKKKKKPKAREVEIGGDDDNDGKTWVPRRTLSSNVLKANRKSNK